MACCLRACCLMPMIDLGVHQLTRIPGKCCLHIGLHLGTLGIHWFLNIFLDFLGIFGIVGQILGFLVPGRSDSCRRLRDLQKSIVILSNGAVWTRNVTLLMKHYPVKNVDLTPHFLALRRSGMYRRLRDLQKSVVIFSNGAVWTRNVTFLTKARFLADPIGADPISSSLIKGP